MELPFCLLSNDFNQIFINHYIYSAFYDKLVNQNA